MSNQEKLLEVLLELGGDLEPVSVSAIRKVWPECPEFMKLLNLGNRELFTVYLEPDGGPERQILLTPEGIAAASKSKKEAEEKRTAKAEKVRDKKKDRAFEIILVFLGWLLGLATPYIVGFFGKLFHG